METNYKRKRIKTGVFLIGAVLINLLNSCTGSGEKKAEELLNNPTTEEEIYSAIISNNSRMTKFMDKMLADESCKKMMTKNSSMVKMMCMSDKMDSLMVNDQQIMMKMTDHIIKKMETDSATCDKTCTRIMDNKQLNDYFKTYMKKNINANSKK